MKISLPQGFNTNVGASSSQRIELPFQYALAYFKNGNPSMKPLAAANRVAYYGGWVIPGGGVFGMDTIMQDSGVPALTNVQQIASDNPDGSSRTDYTIRSLAVAPIASRTGWEFTQNSRKVRQADYTEGGRAFTQMLVYIFDRTTKEEGGKKTAVYTPWTVGQLTVKGWQVTYLKDALRSWEIATLPARTALGDGKAIPYNAFVVNLGTFANPPDFQKKGTKAKSDVTPLVAAIPEQISVESLHYVGDDVAEAMATFYAAAEEWLGAFKKGNKEEIAPSGDVSQTGQEVHEVDEEEPPF